MLCTPCLVAPGAGVHMVEPVTGQWAGSLLFTSPGQSKKLLSRCLKAPPCIASATNGTQVHSVSVLLEVTSQ